jgi:hypothetical protein
MKYIKMLGLLALAAAALMAFAGTASADKVTSSTGVETPTIKAESSHTVLHGSFTAVTCAKSTVEGTVSGHGAGKPVTGNISSLTFSSCNYPVTVKVPGSLSASAISPTGNATLSSSGANIEVHTSVGLCVFKTGATHLGVLTGSSSTGGHAALDISSAKIPQESSNFFCGSSGTWTGVYTVTHPSTFNVHAS